MTINQHVSTDCSDTCLEQGCPVVNWVKFCCEICKKSLHLADRRLQLRELRLSVLSRLLDPLVGCHQ